MITNQPQIPAHMILCNVQLPPCPQKLKSSAERFLLPININLGFLNRRKYPTMAKLTDLPAELVERIANYLIDQSYADSNAHHHDLDHNGIGEFQQNPRPHLDNKDALTGASDHQFSYSNPVYHKETTVNIKPSEYQVTQVSWPGGLPFNPLVSLSLVNRTFRRCAQEMLFKNVGLNQQRASLFHQALTRPSLEDEAKLYRGSMVNYEGGKPDSGNVQIAQPFGIDCPRLNKLARFVRSLQFTWSGPCSMGEGGGSLICDIIRSCPLLENIAISNTFYMCCKEPILEALASRPLIKEFVILGQDRSPTDTVVFRWILDEVFDRLFSKWDKLETIELVGLSRQSNQITQTIPQPITVLNRALKTIILNDPKLNESELSWILKGSMESLLTLKIINPSSELDRPGLFRILKGCTSPNLEVLTIDVDAAWQSIERDAEGSDDPAENWALMDLVFKSSSALRNLKSLSITGPLVGSGFFNLLPDSLVKLAWDECWELRSDMLAQVLSSSRQPVWLPNLKCLSARDYNRWHCRDRRAIEEALQARGVCFHPICGDFDGSQFDDDGPIVDPMRNVMASLYW
ncbi:uncharacterized protein PGTG_03601 [Puccinia graminis f. sp. tritici CRL 75-36-700-3]|uniref:Uncharacterized protein n=1 Tax=Puccinia graminis f. sp. tritici (strain CRL 75-36-700-3 / race SCCL) TaxID=418459 RepID=E3K020_PUCGT|nr:uncharacterized protein PGTG_03601 [Puccinia graminis f. sp. tritici CRL 75-36-700-3]EFP77645.2 hypothetical protein PGTG_03601 [Puccinia graminis f. sp. tritici CRL 75-36-700-3]